MERGKNTQLYSCIETLSSQIRDESSLGLLVGYAIANSLIGFDPVQYGREPRSFKETWAIYEGLVDASNTLSSTSIYPLVARLKEQVNGKLKECIANRDKLNKESDLLSILIDSAKKKNIPLEEFLKEMGSRLSQKTLVRGLSSEAINRVYTEDYKLFEKTFSK